MGRLIVNDLLVLLPGGGREHFRRLANAYCPACGKQESWENGDGRTRLCLSCGTVLPELQIRRAAGVWLEALAQIRLAQRETLPVGPGG